MKNYSFSKLKLGKTFRNKKKISNKLIKDFVKLSGDKSPIHVSNSFAKKYGFKNKIAHGALLNTIYSKIIGVDFIGKNSLLLSINLDFLKPVYVNDEITTIAKIINLNKVFKVVTISFKSHNQSHKNVCKAEANVKLNE